MATIDVQEVEAGPALDTAVARVRGDAGYDKRVYHYEYHDKVVTEQKPRPASTQIGEAWKLVEAMEHAAWDVSVRAVVALPDECSVYREDDELLALAQTIPLAICRAFLLANGVTTIEVGDTERSVTGSVE